MATATGKTKCIKCGKDKATSKCSGCAQEFCYNHLGEHRQELNKQLDDIEGNRDVFRETLNQHTNQSEKYPLIQEINQWEQDSIQKIKQTAEEARQSILKLTAKNNKKIEEQLNELTNRLRQGRQEDDVNEINLQKWKEQLIELNEQFAKPSNVAIRHTSTPLTTYIHVDTFPQINLSNIPINAKWIQNGITVAGGNGKGNGLNQLNQPFGIYVNDDQSMYVAEQTNHRIVKWDKGAITGQVVAGGNAPGNQNSQLNSPWNVIVDKENDFLIISDYSNRRVVRWSRLNGTNGETIISNVGCRGLAMDKNGYLYFSDLDKHSVRRWKIGETEGTLVAGGNGQGSRPDQLSYPFYIFVDEDQSVYVSDYSNHRIMKWLKGAKEGIVVAGGQGAGNSLTQLSYPLGIIVDQLGTVYIADYQNHGVMRWLKGAKEGSVVVGGNGSGAQANQLNQPSDLSFDAQNNLYIVDCSNHRVQKFSVEL